MIPQLVQQIATAIGGPTPANLQLAQAEVLTSDPLDLVLRMEQVWNDADLWAQGQPPAGPARTALIGLNAFETGQWTTPPNAPLPVPTGTQPAWDHLIYAYAIENTRAPQILARVVRAFRSGEGLGVASVATQRWLDATEALLFGATNPFAAWLSTSSVRPDAEAVRRNAYFRLLGMDLAHGTDTNTPYPYDKAEASNRGFVTVFEELLFELWRAIENVRNLVAGNTTDDDRIYRLAEQLGFMLRSRRIDAVLGREELAATTAMGWVELTVSSNTSVVRDLRAEATSSVDRLRIIGERVRLAPHSRASSFFAMAAELSLLLRALEGGWVTGNGQSWLLYQTTPPPGMPPLPPGQRPLGAEVRRVITEWAAASGHDLKQRTVPVTVVPAGTPLPARR
ncbi:hypothetical protein G7075_17620 [Phycicoccus sp. HDW14]|uniref:hypothetical protein n=1 Tax=Phycicoccus sp. HDW14 TaxID=2714941 RepID=UPI00140E5F8B|nr:hypothetical protein [Phycicoccus sp. HDW14]QIM22524.1 hypothetical protein G7075_17620 [Phycicoccus sp. HDW14]